MSDFSVDLEKGLVSVSESEVHNRNNSTAAKTSCSISPDGKTVFLGGMAIDKAELSSIFSVQPPTIVQVEQTAWRPMGNPMPLAFAAFGIATFTLSLILMGAGGASNPKFMIASALCLSGLLTTSCGFLCFFINQTFAATALTSFGAFYLCYAVILIDFFGIASSYTTVDEFNTVMGFWLTAWCIYGAVLQTLTLKGSVEVALIIFLVLVFLIFLTIFYFTGILAMQKVAGVFAFLSSMNAYYLLWSLQANEEMSFINAPVLMMPGYKKKI